MATIWLHTIYKVVVADICQHPNFENIYSDIKSCHVQLHYN